MRRFWNFIRRHWRWVVGWIVAILVIAMVVSIVTMYTAPTPVATPEKAEETKEEAVEAPPEQAEPAKEEAVPAGMSLTDPWYEDGAIRVHASAPGGWTFHFYRGSQPIDSMTGEKTFSGDHALYMTREKASGVYPVLVWGEHTLKGNPIP